MQQQRQVELIERVLGLIDAKSTDMSAGTSHSRGAHYTDPERFDHELGVVLDGSPIAIGGASELRSPGTYLTHAHACCRIAVVRGKDGELSAFSNACRHRGMPLLTGRSGTLGNSIICRYHGWNYALSGELLHVPHAFGFPDVGCPGERLPRFGASSRHGVIWVQKGAQPPDVERHLGSELCAELTSWGFDDFVAVERVCGTPACNWKLLVDGGLEAYHFRRAHEGTVYPYFLDNVALVDFFGPHVRLVLAKRSVSECRSTSRADWRLLDHANVLYFVFPNTFFLVQKDRVTHVGIYPQAVDRSDFVITTLVAREPATDKERSFFEQNSRLVNDALLEDQELAVGIHDSLRGRALDTLRFGRFEHALAHFHRELAALSS